MAYGIHPDLIFGTDNTPPQGKAYADAMAKGRAKHAVGRKLTSQQIRVCMFINPKEYDLTEAEFEALRRFMQR